MSNEFQNNDNPIIQDDDLYGKKLNAKPVPDVSIGVDLKDTFIDSLANYGGESSQIDITKIESFKQVSQARDQVYDLIDTMSNDPTMSAVLETYAEDATETNENGDIVWVESDIPEIGKYITYLLDSMEINKHIYKWVYSLCKYGDCYLRLYKNSDFEDFLDVIDSGKDKDSDKKKLNEQLNEIHNNQLIERLSKDLSEEDKKKLQEDVIVRAYSKNDKYAHYIEMVANPAEMFELTKFGKSYSYIKAPVNVGLQRMAADQMYPSTFRYVYRLRDVQVFEPTIFVHACLDENSTRQPEIVSIFLNDEINLDSDSSYTFNVKRGQSILYNTFKIWRELSLLENALLLNRITKSSIIRIIGVEVGDMPKENIPKHLMRIKQLIEQKSALDTGKSLNEYTNPGPMENNVYIPTHNGQGTITTQQVGGDVDVRQIADIDYFRDKLFGAIKIPKQYFGFTDDGAGFNGGQSLSIISSRYAKTIKRIQNTMIQALTDAINLMLLDKGLDSYINKYNLRMQEPTTQEQIDRRDNMSTKIAVASDIMNLLAEVEDASAKLKILKALLSNIVTDSEILDIIQTQIDLLEEQEDMGVDTTEFNNGETNPMLGGHSSPGRMDPNDVFNNPESDIDVNISSAEDEGTSDTMTLPNPSELGGDFTDANMEI